MSDLGTENRKARVIKANRLLQSKVGSGPLNEKMVAECQNIIDQSELDFEPIALMHLDSLDRAVQTAKQDDGQTPIGTSLTKPVMEIKANATMFGYPLIGSLARIMLSFLESVVHIDKDILAIVEAHKQTLIAIIGNDAIGRDGGIYAEQLQKELKEACNRYYKKKPDNRRTAV